MDKKNTGYFNKLINKFDLIDIEQNTEHNTDNSSQTVRDTCKKKKNTDYILGHEEKSY